MKRMNLQKRINPRPLQREQIFRRILTDLPESEHFDLVHGMDILSFRPAVEAASQHNALIVLDVNEIPNIHARTHSAFRNIPPTTRGMVNDRTKEALNKADLILTTGDTCCNYVTDFSGAGAKSFINARPSDAATDQNLLRETIGVDRSVFLNVYVNTAAPHFGVEQSIRAMTFLPDQHHLCFVGRFFDENYKQQSMDYASELGVLHRIHVVEGLVGEDYIKMISGGDIGLVPLDPANETNRYVAPARAFDLIAAELPVAFSLNNEMAAMNKKFCIGFQIGSFRAASIAKAIQNLADMSLAHHARIKAEIIKAKQHYDIDRIVSECKNQIMDLFDEKEKSRNALIVCNNSVVNNVRLPRFLKIYEDLGFKNTVYCINTPKSEILNRFELKQTEFHFVDIEKELDDQRISTMRSASIDYAGKLASLGARSVLKSSIRPRLDRVDRVIKKALSKRENLNAERQMRVTKDFATAVRQRFGRERYDYVLTHDIFAFPPVHHFIEKYGARHVMDITEIPDMNQRAGKSFREMPDRHKAYFSEVEKDAEDTASAVYTTSQAMASFLSDRYQRNIGILPNARPALEAPADPFIRQKLGVPEDAILLVANCTYTPESKPTTCISALKYLPENVYLLFLGNPTNPGFGRRVKDFASKNKLAGRVLFHDPIYGDDYLRVLAACDIGLNVFTMDHLQLRLILPNRVLDLVAARCPVISSPMEDVGTMGKKFGNIRILDEKVSVDTLAASIAGAIDQFGIHQGRVKSAAATKALDNAAGRMNWEVGASRFVSEFESFGEGKRILFTARQRLHANVRIMRQCRSLNDAGFDVHLVGINEGPSEDLRNIAPKTKIDILPIDWN